MLAPSGCNIHLIALFVRQILLYNWNASYSIHVSAIGWVLMLCDNKGTLGNEYTEVEEQRKMGKAWE